MVILQQCLEKMKLFYDDQLTPVARKLIQNWPEKIKAYRKGLL